jgi:TRAP-type C4-dicarboxylate transport system substrate-binding protein
MNAKKFFKIVSVLFAFALVLSSTSVFASSKIILKFNTFVKSADQKGQEGQTTFKKVVEQLTDGKVEVKFYYW